MIYLSCHKSDSEGRERESEREREREGKELGRVGREENEEVE